MQTSFKLDRHPGLLFHPARLETVVGSINGHIHQVTPFNYFETTVGHVRGVNSDENRKVLDILHMSVRSAVNMRREASRTGKFVVYFSPQSAKVLQNPYFTQRYRKLTLLFE